MNEPIKFEIVIRPRNKRDLILILLRLVDKIMTTFIKPGRSQTIWDKNDNHEVGYFLVAEGDIEDGK